MDREEIERVYFRLKDKKAYPTMYKLLGRCFEDMETGEEVTVMEICGNGCVYVTTDEIGWNSYLWLTMTEIEVIMSLYGENAFNAVFKGDVVSEEEIKDGDKTAMCKKTYRTVYEYKGVQQTVDRVLKCANGDIVWIEEVYWR